MRVYFQYKMSLKIERVKRATLPMNDDSQGESERLTLDDMEAFVENNRKARFKAKIQ